MPEPHNKYGDIGSTANVRRNAGKVWLNGSYTPALLITQLIMFMFTRNKNYLLLQIVREHDAGCATHGKKDDLSHKYWRLSERATLPIRGVICRVCLLKYYAISSRIQCRSASKR